MSSRLLTLLLFCLTLLVGGCGEDKPPPPERPKEPKGAAVSLAKSEHQKRFPEFIREHQSWVKKSDRLRLKGAHDKALFCLHQAEEVFPAEFPADWKGPQVPLGVYLRKADLYSFKGKVNLAQYFLDRVKEVPDRSDALKVFEAQAQALLYYVRGEYQSALDLAGSNQGPVFNVVAAAAKVRLGDESARKELKTAWVRLKGAKKGLYNYVPAGIRDLANE